LLYSVTAPRSADICRLSCLLLAIVSERGPVTYPARRAMRLSIRWWALRYEWKVHVIAAKLIRRIAIPVPKRSRLAEKLDEELNGFLEMAVEEKK